MSPRQRDRLALDGRNPVRLAFRWGYCEAAVERLDVRMRHDAGMVAKRVLPVSVVAVLLLIGTAWSAGRLDRGFGHDGRVVARLSDGRSPDVANAVAVQPDGRIVVAGSSRIRGRGEELTVARFLPNGRLDRSFAGDGVQRFGFSSRGVREGATDIALQPDGKIVVVGGSEDEDSFEWSVVVARLNRDGSLDTHFSGDGMRRLGRSSTWGPNAEAVAVQPDGRIVVAGCRDVSNFLVARLHRNGAIDRAFAADGEMLMRHPARGTSCLTDLAIQPDRKLIAVGYSGHDHIGVDFDVLRITPRGRLDRSFSGDGDAVIKFGLRSDFDAAFGVALRRDGRIVVAGGTTSPNHGESKPRLAVAQLRRDGSLDRNFAGNGRRVVQLGPGDGRGCFPEPGLEVCDEWDIGLALQRHGRIVIAATSPSRRSKLDFAVLRLTAAGRLDRSFSGDGRRLIGFREEPGPNGCEVSINLPNLGQGRCVDGANAVAVHRGIAYVVGETHRDRTGRAVALAAVELLR